MCSTTARIRRHSSVTNDEESTLTQEREQTADEVTEAIARVFDDLVAKMNRPGAGQATDSALFAHPASLNRTYRPGETETIK